MSQRLIDRSPDLKRLRDEGYHVEIEAGYLLLRDVPYINSRKEVRRGTLVSTLKLANDATDKPDTHVARFAGEHPCHMNGSEIAQLTHGRGREQLADGLVVDFSFSNKPSAGYVDYYEKMTTYANIISGPAQAIDSTATAKSFPLVRSDDEDLVFKYIDTASSRAGIAVATKKLEINKLAIVGLGGSGSYVLDFVAKTPAKEIHLFDGDTFSQHNAFRAPGAPSGEDLDRKLSKVTFFYEIYSRMRRGIISHEFYIDVSNVDQLQGMDFVFVCMDKGRAKKLIIEKLEEFGIPFVDVGMGIQLDDHSLRGILRVTASTPKKRKHVHENKRITFADGVDDDEYARNIQIADLNALNAALAVIKWKKLFGFYHDLEDEHHSTYTIDVNMLTSDDRL